MKLRLTLLLSLFAVMLLLYGCGRNAKPAFSISGRISNLPPGPVSFYREDDINRKKRTLVARIPVSGDGSFRMDFDLEPHLYTLELNNLNGTRLAIGKEQRIEIRGDATKPELIKVSGSPDTLLLQEYERFRKESLDRLVLSVRRRIKELEAEEIPPNTGELAKIGDLEVTNYEKHKDELNEFIKSKLVGSIALYATTLRWEGEQNLPLFSGFSKKFEAAHPGLAVTTRIKEKIALIKATSPGGIAPAIQMPDRDGRIVSLSPGAAKYTLVDFWASWCGPCRRESRDLNEAYEEYGKRGFEIYGVSLDDSRDVWLEAMAKDKRTWTNVSTLQGFETPTTFDYSVTALPSKFLIDDKGKIVAKDLHGAELVEKLKELFQRSYK